MPNKGFDRYKIGAFAYLFIQHPDKTVPELAKLVSVADTTPYSWLAAGELDKALDTFKFTGDRTLRRKVSRDVARDAGDAVSRAKSVYLKERANGMNKGQASKHTAAAVEVSEKTIFNWRKRFGWDLDRSRLDDTSASVLEEGTDAN